jgi:20S proteasome alpha/beta subunit
MLERVVFYPGPKDEPESLGTTLIAVKYDNGIVMVSDSMVTRGSMVSSFNFNKITRLSDNICVMSSGKAADPCFLNKIIAENLEYHSIEKKGLPLVYTAAHMYRNIIYNNKRVIESSYIICGYDEKKGFQIYTINQSGSLIENPLISRKGSGGVYIEGYLDSVIRDNLTYNEARDIVLKGIQLATRADLSSASHVNMYNITKDGCYYEKYSNCVNNH